LTREKKIRIGDVDTSKIVKATSEDGKQVIEGLSGRKLALGNWNCPSGEYRVGLKRAYELFPSDLKSRIKAVINI
jgi:tripeptidyl-peptidase-2